MIRFRWIAVALVITVGVVIVVTLFLFRPKPQPPSGPVDLIERFPDAEKRTTMSRLEDGFNIVDVTINGELRRSIFAHPHSRIIWTVDIPERAVLHTAVALQPHVYTLPGDGAQFRVGVADDERYEELFKRTVNPGQNPDDRRWIPVSLDLSPWAGEFVQVIFNTDPGPGGNAVHDAAVWGAPRIVVAQ